MPFSKKTRRKAKEQAHYICCLCHKRSAFHVHHIIPESETGDNSLDNAAPLCVPCHDTHGHDPAKRGHIKQVRNWWREECKRSETPVWVIEAEERFKKHAASKEDLQEWGGKLMAEIRGISQLPATSSAELQVLCDGTNAATHTASFLSHAWDSIFEPPVSGGQGPETEDVPPKS